MLFEYNRSNNSSSKDANIVMAPLNSPSPYDMATIIDVDASRTVFLISRDYYTQMNPIRWTTWRTLTWTLQQPQIIGQTRISSKPYYSGKETQDRDVQLHKEVGLSNKSPCYYSCSWFVKCLVPRTVRNHTPPTIDLYFKKTHFHDMGNRFKNGRRRLSDSKIEVGSQSIVTLVSRE